MTPARQAVLREAESHAAMLRRAGYPEAMVAPEYCIGGEIGPDRFYTYTVSIYAGDHKPESLPKGIAAVFKAAQARLAK